MAILAAGLREWNFNKVMRLTKAGCSDATIASAINDDLADRQITVAAPITDVDITSWKVMSKLAGKHSLIAEPTIRALCNIPEPDMSLI